VLDLQGYGYLPFSLITTAFRTNFHPKEISNGPPIPLSDHHRISVITLGMHIGITYQKWLFLGGPKYIFESRCNLAFEKRNLESNCINSDIAKNPTPLPIFRNL